MHIAAHDFHSFGAWHSFFLVCLFILGSIRNAESESCSVVSSRFLLPNIFLARCRSMVILSSSVYLKTFFISPSFWRYFFLDIELYVDSFLFIPFSISLSCLYYFQWKILLSYIFVPLCICYIYFCDFLNFPLYYWFLVFSCSSLYISCAESLLYLVLWVYSSQQIW